MTINEAEQARQTLEDKERLVLATAQLIATYRHARRTVPDRLLTQLTEASDAQVKASDALVLARLAALERVG